MYVFVRLYVRVCLCVRVCACVCDINLAHDSNSVVYNTRRTAALENLHLMILKAIAVNRQLFLLNRLATPIAYV